MQAPRGFESLTLRHYLYDALGSVTAVTDSGGAAVNRYSYTPYGETLSATEAIANPWQYVGIHGYQRDVGSLHKVGLRYMSAAAGRWTQRDPARLERNGYAYANCSPTNFVDPTGGASCTEALLATAVGFGLLDAGLIIGELIAGVLAGETFMAALLAALTSPVGWVVATMAAVALAGVWYAKCR